MSAALQKLERLLLRVQTRRDEPRALGLAPQPAPIEAPFSAPPPSTGRVSKVPALTPLEESMEKVVPVARPAEAQPSAFESKTLPHAPPDSEDLFLDDFEPQTIAPAAMPASTPVKAPAPVAAAPARAPAPAARAETFEAPAPIAAPAFVAPAPITSATARIAPAPSAASASPVAAVSKARVIEPKNFGELLDLSLALRPSK